MFYLGAGLTDNQPYMYNADTCTCNLYRRSYDVREKFSFCTRDTTGLKKILEFELTLHTSNSQIVLAPMGKALQIHYCLVAKSTCPGQLELTFLKPSTVGGRFKVHVGV